MPPSSAQAKASGYGGTFYNVSFVGTQALADELGKDGAGVVVSQVVPSPYTRRAPIAREFSEAVKKAGGDYQVNFSSIEGYIAAKVLTEALRRTSGKPTREGLIAGLESLGSQHHRRLQHLASRPPTTRPPSSSSCRC